jgi:quercetin dioxygenase-like cupin family protein
MLSAKELKIGDLNGFIYDFQFAGDVLPTHIHDEATNHITVVAKGRLKAKSDTWEREAGAGQIMDFVVGEPHELIAMEDDTRIINIVKKLTPVTV